MKRRDALAFLGLVGTSSVALATENMVETDQAIAVGNNWNAARTARALRRLADGIESKSVEVFNLEVNSVLALDDFVKQRLSIEFNVPSAFDDV